MESHGRLPYLKTDCQETATSLGSNLMYVRVTPFLFPTQVPLLIQRSQEQTTSFMVTETQIAIKQYGQTLQWGGVWTVLCIHVWPCTTWISKNAGKIDVKWELAHTKPSKSRSTALTRVSSLAIQIHHITFKIYGLHPPFTQPRQHWQIKKSRPPHSFNEYQITRVNLGIGIKDV